MSQKNKDSTQSSQEQQISSSANSGNGETNPNDNSSTKTDEMASGDPNVHTEANEKEICRIKVPIGDLFQYTKSLPVYSQESREAFKVFDQKLKSVVNKLLLSSDYPQSINSFMRYDLLFDTYTDSLLCTIFTDFLEGAAAETTRIIRETKIHRISLSAFMNY